MADNIKIIGNIINTTTVTRYSSEDTNLISSTNLQENFGETGDYIEYSTYDASGNFLNINYNYLNYKLPPSIGLTPGTSSPPNTTGNIQTTDVGITSTLATPTSSLYPVIEIDPVADLQNTGYTSGEFNVRYNLFHNILSNNNDRALFVKEISQDRTEIRLASTTLTNDEIETTVNNIINQINSSSFYVDYLLNFGDNQQYVAVNIALNKATTGYEVLFKMYEPLPLEIQEKQTLWVVKEKVSPYIFDINLDTLVIPTPPPSLRGPNFNIPTPNQGTISTAYTNYNTALLSLQSLQSSSYQQLLNLMTTQSISINVDYTDFNNFTFFGSAYQRVVNFYNKVQQIENYTNLINLYTPYALTTASLQTEINQYSSSINTLISQFDGYETYLYFESSSYTWPKSNLYKPYSLLSTGSAAVISWYEALTGSAQTYDNENYDNLVYAVPNFIRDDENNNQFLTFLNMVGQYFDNIWIYLKAVTDINLANNNLNAGISKDLVYNQLQSLGIKLYNSQAGESVDQFLIGANTGSSVFDDDFSITGSYLNNIPRKDLLAELYKRIYHNLPLLLKTKGTKTGLETLITTFGIPSRTYTTGSAISSSILDVKEYGGSLKSDLIKGYNTEKVRIVSNNITGSVLSPMLSLQTFPTSSNEFRENDNQYIDISFSPETQINSYISGAIASNNPTWILDDYIGDPRQLYSSSYIDLDTQRKLYFETGVPGFSGFTGSYLDYNGFIRLIQFFDNALFKMLGDFVPERTSLSTGVTIESPVLERNKAVYSVPKIINQEVYDAEYPTPTISEQYGTFYDNLGGDKSAFFTGELTGSELDIHHTFEEANFNPYLENWKIYNKRHPLSQSINLNTFKNSDFNVLFNNVSSSVTSSYRKHIEYIWGTTGSIVNNAELQDSYLTLRSYQISRYEGSKLTSLNYNTYTSASYINGLVTQSGDISYGKTATIDRNSYKLGWIQTIPTQTLNFYDKTSINLKYLVDTKNEVTDLNSYNNNVVEVQNIFKSGKPATLSITDKNQNRRDGIKTVWKGGYSYNPIIYRENGEPLTFIYDTPISSQSLALGFLSSDPRQYEFSSFTFHNDGFDTFTPDGGFGGSGDPSRGNFKIDGVNSVTTWKGAGRLADRAYTPSEWPYQYITPALNTNIATNIVATAPSTAIETAFKQFWDGVYGYGTVTRDGGPIYRFNIFNFDNFIKSQTITGNPAPTRGFFNEPISSSYLGNVYKVERGGYYYIDGGVTFQIFVYDDDPGACIFKVALIVEKADNYNDYNNDKWNNTWNTSGITNGKPIVSNLTVTPYVYGGGGDRAIYDPIRKSMLVDGDDILKSNLLVDMKLPSSLQYYCQSGEYLRISFVFMDIGNLFTKNNVWKTLKFKNPYWSVRDKDNTTIDYNYVSQYTSSLSLFSISSSYKTNDTLNFSRTFTNYFYSSSFSGSNPNYSEVIDHFAIQKGDLIKFGRFKDPGSYYEVIDAPSPSNISNTRVIVSNTILTGSRNYASNNFAIFRPKPDETSVILEGRNAAGTQAIGQALLVPYDASETLNNNIGTILKSLNTSL